MYITELETPAVLLDLDIAEKNLQTYQQACDKYEKSLWKGRCRNGENPYLR